jgi:hypothetical protein
MKKQLIFLFLAAVLFLGCKKTGWEYSQVNFNFDEPQPANVSELSIIPENFRGHYILDDTELIITQDYIISSLYAITVEHKSILKDSVKEKFSYRMAN